MMQQLLDAVLCSVWGAQACFEEPTASCIASMLPTADKLARWAKMGDAQ